MDLEAEMGMLLSHSTWGMPTVPIDVAVKHCAELGFDGLQLTVRPGWTTDAAGLDAAERRRIRALYDDHGLDLCGLSGQTSMLADDPAEHEENMRRLRSYLDLAAELQGPGEALSVATTSGGKPEDWDAVKGRLVDRFGEMAAYARERGVILAVEPHVGAALQVPEDVVWLVEQVGSPAFRVDLDLSHFNVQGLDVEAVAARLVPHAAHVEIKDERGRAPDHEFLIPGEGECDYVRCLRALERAGYRGHVAVEISVMVQARPDYDPLAAAEQSYRVLSRAFEEAGIARERH